MSNITIRGRRDISCSTSKLINKKTAITRLPRAVSVISLHDCQTKISTKNFYQYKKSLSLQDLSPASQKNVNLKRRLFSQMENEQITSPRETEIEPLNQDRMKNLAVKVYVAFLRNAMTKLLHKCTQQDNSISTMNAQIKNSKMQITTLKSLLRSDEQFIRDWIKELRKLRKKIELLTNERDDLRIENHNIESNYEELQEKFTQVKVELLNEKNLLEQARGEATAFENQLIKEREKIQTLRNELKKASEKVLELQKKRSNRSLSSKNSLRRNNDQKKNN
ncbi:hypothetical protein O3M35_007303 [Rhynocoris fuscipes]|uniref:Uncharacterized protein n=1 Tax=Rhynocoris fuscipes TaxID=488301 RepID=A0AAW1DGE4_9HEMI